jgi:hypothetical protein
LHRDIAREEMPAGDGQALQQLDEQEATQQVLDGAHS